MAGSRAENVAPSADKDRCCGDDRMDSGSYQQRDNQGADGGSRTGGRRQCQTGDIRNDDGGRNQEVFAAADKFTHNVDEVHVTFSISGNIGKTNDGTKNRNHGFMCCPGDKGIEGHFGFTCQTGHCDAGDEQNHAAVVFFYNRDNGCNQDHDGDVQHDGTLLIEES